MKRQWKVAVGFAILAVLVGLGIIPARRALTVRVNAPQSAKGTRRPSRRSSRRGLLRHPAIRAVLRRLRKRRG